MKNKAIALLGTGSDVGKSICVTALCRIFKRQGLSVAPFKAQNMSNNSFVTLDGGEMGRAQIVQAEAAGVEPHVDMNPVLIKPCTDTGAQVILHGKALGNREAKDYFGDTSFLKQKSDESLKRLQDQYEMIVMEGAGSCAEVNLRDRDFVNFEMAHTADCPVILVADIDRGGVFAQIIGSLAVMPEKDRQRVKGFIINRFRGDLSLFQDGVDYIEKETALPVLGVIPYFRHIEIESEDALPLEAKLDSKEELDKSKIHIAVIRLPHISNFTDFNSLQREEGVEVHYLSKVRDLTAYDAVILPGSKNVRFDRQWLSECSWDEEILKAHDQGKKISGVCGGYQILGKEIHDPYGVEGEPGMSEGLGLLDVVSTLEKEKTLCRSEAHCALWAVDCSGYEIHMGQSQLGEEATPFLKKGNGDEDGAVNSSGSIWGSYFHACFDQKEFRESYLQSVSSQFSSKSALHQDDFKELQYELLAEHFTTHLDMAKLFCICSL